MIRARKQKEKVCKCPNCFYEITIVPERVKEKTFDIDVALTVTATYVECPVCGENILKQLDDYDTLETSRQGIKLDLLKRDSKKKLSKAQRTRLQSIETMLYNRRLQLKKKYWDEIYQSLNQC